FRSEALHRQFHDAGARYRSADHQSAGDDDDDIIGKAGERLGGRHNAQQHGRQQRADRHYVIAPAAPDERNHHERDDGEGENLRQGHQVVPSGWALGSPGGRGGGKGKLMGGRIIGGGLEGGVVGASPAPNRPLRGGGMSPLLWLDPVKSTGLYLLLEGGGQEGV